MAGRINRKISIYKARAWVYDKPILGQQNGGLEITYIEDDKGYSYTGKSITSTYPLTAVWVDPGQTSQPRVCKAYAQIPYKPKNADEQQALKFAESLRDNGIGTVRAYFADMKVSVDRHFKTLIYDCHQPPYKSESTDNYTKTPIFDSKGQAVNALLAAIESNSSMSKVTGTDLINLNAISDETMAELGFIKVPEHFSGGAPMWYGDPEECVTLGESSYSYRSTYGHNYGGRDKPSNETQNTREEVIASLLDLIELELT